MIKPTYLDLVGNVEGVIITSIGEDDTVQSSCKSVCGSCGAARPHILEVDLGILNLGITPQNNKTGHYNEEQGANLYNPNSIREPISIFRVENQSCIVLNCNKLEQCL